MVRIAISQAAFAMVATMQLDQGREGSGKGHRGHAARIGAVSECR